MPPPTKPPSKKPAGYAAHREKMAAVSRERSVAGREVGPIPKVRNRSRKSGCKLSLRKFCETYLTDRFSLAWSDDHLTVIGRLEAALLKGGLFALAMPRASGKTSLCEGAALWAILYGHRRFVALVGASEVAAVELLESIKMAVETNDRLGEDFPEVCHPIRMLEGQNNRANGQTVGGVRTRIGWSDKEAVFPTVKGSKSAGSRIQVAGITGRVRGMKAATADGKTIRPDFVIVDDPQNDDSAESLAQTGKRERILTGAVKGMSAPGTTISMVVPCTVIARDDLSDRILDRQRNPQFRGERMRMVYQLPERMDLWARYADLRNESFRSGGDGEEATEFYRQNWAEMDRGAVVAWPARYDRRTELSAVQAAMNLKIDNPISFAAEYQNEPLTDSLPGMRSLDADALAGRLSGVPRFEVPRECSNLSAFIDCGKGLLWYAVAAWDGKFGGSVIDYGCWPAQARAHFRKDDPRPSLADFYRGIDSDDARLHAGLRDLIVAVVGRDYRRAETGEPHRVGTCLIDRGYKPDVIHKACRASVLAAVLRPSIGHSVGSTGKPVRQWSEVMAGEQHSPQGSPAWRWGYARGEHAVGRRLIFDADEWKSFAADRLLTPPGGFAPLMLFGKEQAQHRMLCEHLTAEFGAPARTTGGLEYEKWANRPNRDNDLWDAVVGCCVAASVGGLMWSAGRAAGESVPPAEARKRRKLSEVYRAKHGGAE